MKSRRLGFLGLFGLLASAAVPAVGAESGVIPGLEVLLTERNDLVEGRRIGLITNHTAVDRRMRHVIDLLSAVHGARLTALFAPEHGIRGMVRAGGSVVDTIDERSGVPVYGIYGQTRRPTADMLKDVDVRRAIDQGTPVDEILASWRPYEGELCHGVQVHVTDRRTFEPVRTGLTALRALVELYPEHLELREYVSRLAGVENLHERIWEEAADTIIAGWQEDLAAFMQLRERHLLYGG